MPMPFCRPDNLRTVTWALSGGSPASGTPLDGYDVENLTDGDPSNPLAIEETTVGLVGDLGAALPISGVALVHHNFQEGTTLRLRVNATDSWGGAIDITVTATVGAWLGRFAPHVYFNVEAAADLATRTKRYLFLDNTVANDVPVKIGEIVVAGVVDEFSGVLVDVKPSLTYGRSKVAAKKGPEYIHDRRTRDRDWTGSAFLEDDDDIEAFEGLQDQSYGVRPFLIWPLNSIDDEPIYARFSTPTYDPTLPVDLSIKQVEFAVKELSCGEAY